MVAAAHEADPEGEYVEADAARLPFDGGAADLALAFMSLMDMDDMPAALHEIARVLRPEAPLTVVHPLNSASLPRSDSEESGVVIRSYRERRRYTETFERNSLEMTFESMHYSLEDYWRALRDARFVVEDLRELYDDAHPRWHSVPLFLRFDARKPA